MKSFPGAAASDIFCFSHSLTNYTLYRTIEKERRSLTTK